MYDKRARAAYNRAYYRRKKEERRLLEEMKTNERPKTKKQQLLEKRKKKEQQRLLEQTKKVNRDWQTYKRQYYPNGKHGIILTGPQASLTKKWKKKKMAEYRRAYYLRNKEKILLSYRSSKRQRIILPKPQEQSRGMRVLYEAVANVFNETANIPEGNSEIPQPECVWLEDVFNETSDTASIKSKIDYDSYDLTESDPEENFNTIDHSVEASLSQDIKIENVICKYYETSQPGEVIVTKSTVKAKKGRELLESVYDRSITAQLPNRSCELPTKSLLFPLPESCGKRNDDTPYYRNVTTPIYRKQIVFNENDMLKVYFDDKLYSCHKLSANLTMAEEQLLDDVRKFQLCKGGPCGSFYMILAPEYAYRDCSGVWRHNNCPIEIIKGRICDECATLKDTFYKLARQKPNVFEQTANVPRGEIPQSECILLEDEVDEASNTVSIKSEIDIDAHDLIKSEPEEKNDANEIFTIEHSIKASPAIAQKGQELFEGVYNQPVTVQLPNTNKICEIPSRSFIFSSVENGGKPNNDGPNHSMLKVYYNDKLQSCYQLSENLSLTDLKQLLTDVNKVQLCKGGPCGSLYSTLASQFAYMDCSGVWRHNNCPIKITNGLVCDQCATLEDTFFQLTKQQQSQIFQQEEDVRDVV